jgi:hypothetical protein
MYIYIHTEKQERIYTEEDIYIYAHRRRSGRGTIDQAISSIVLVGNERLRTAMAKVVMVLGLLVAVMSAMAMRTEGAISCPQMVKDTLSCIPFMLFKELDPDCCPGIKKVFSLVKSTADWQAACGCLTAGPKDYTTDRAATLPRICGARKEDCPKCMSVKAPEYVLLIV